MKDSGVVSFIFIPKNFTPVCTAQACTFPRRERRETRRSEGVQVVGVSADDTAAHSKFAAKHRVPYPLLSDPDEDRSKSEYEARQHARPAPRSA